MYFTQMGLQAMQNEHIDDCLTRAEGRRMIREAKRRRISTATPRQHHVAILQTIRYAWKSVVTHS